MIRYVRLLALLSLFALLACAKHYFHADTAEYEGITVQPTLVVASGDKLWVRTTVTNSGTQPIVVNRDAIVARLPSGMVVGRAMGTTTIHEPYFIAGGMSHEVNVEFHEAGFDWHVVPQATIDFTAGITRNGQRIPILLGVVP
ncbi:MAG TPA: hypothetical protein VLM85_02760 [Polyangiaceae bacterium]|nr:hypothetical protein [Polyangiaceae bacterium]